MRPARHWQPAAIGSFLALLAAPAAAQQQPDPVPPTLAIGPVEFRPRLVLNNVGIDDNVFNEVEDPKRDFTATISPDLEIAVRPGPLRLTLLTGTDYVYFRRYASERSTNRRFATTAELETALARPFVSYSAAQLTSRPGHEIDARVRQHPETLSGGVRLPLSARTASVVTLRRSRAKYEPGATFRGVELARTLDSRTIGYDAAVEFEATPLTTLSLAAGREEVRFDFSPIRDSRSFRIAPTIRISPLGLLTGSGSVGYRRFEALDPAVPSFSGLTANGSLGVLLADRYRIDTTFGRDVRYSYEEAFPYFVQSAAGLAVGSYLAAGFDVRAHTHRETMDYRAFAGGDSPGRDRVTIYGATLGYRVAERMRLAVTAERLGRVSERDRIREYRNTRLFAGLTWGATTR